MVISDYARDFPLDAVQKDKDFNVFRYIREHNLGTFMLERLVIKFLKQIDVSAGKQAEALMNGDQPFEDDDIYISNTSQRTEAYFMSGMAILSALWKWQHKREKKPWDHDDDYDWGDVT